MAEREPLVIGPSLWRLADRAMPRALGVGVFLATFLSAVGRPAELVVGRPLTLGSVPEFALVLAVALASAGAVWMAPRRRWPLFAVAFAVLVAFGTWYALCAASYVAATTFRRRAHLAAYLLAVAAVGIPLHAFGPSEFWPSMGAFALFVALPLVAGLWVNARREMLRERAEHLEREQTARAEQARAQERARIAREMHDVVAHQVSLIVLQAGALQVNASDESVATSAGQIRATGREALSQLRGVLGVLRSPEAEGAGLAPQPVLRDLDGLLDQSRIAGLPIVRRDEGEPRPLPAVVERAAYRVVQEGLTNIHKHTDRTSAEVRLDYTPAELLVTVTNAPPARLVAPSPGSGLGLVGLRERVELLGGELSASRAPDGGFALTARIPAPDGDAA
jgi:signal transduction histidine kinase